MEKRIKGDRRERNGLGFGLFEHGRRKNYRTIVEIIRIKKWRCIVAYMNNWECLPTIFFHIVYEMFWDVNATIFVQTKFRFHIFPLTDSNFISNVVGRIISRVKRFH